VIKVFDISGKFVRTIISEGFPAGYHEVAWDGKDNNNHEVSSGMYIYRILSGGLSESKRMTFIK